MALRREVVVRTALRLLNEVGLEGLTLRRIADELGVRAPALYWHLRDKQELLDHMATTVYADAFDHLEPPGRGETWLEWFAEVGRTTRRALLAYRDGARMFSGMFARDGVTSRPTELVLRTLVDAGFTIRDASRAANTMYSFVIGYTIEEQAIFSRPGIREPRYETAFLRGQFDTDRFPLLTQSLDELFRADPDVGFEHGLQSVLAGIRLTRFGR